MPQSSKNDSMHTRNSYSVECSITGMLQMTRVNVFLYHIVGTAQSRERTTYVVSRIIPGMLFKQQLTESKRHHELVLNRLLIYISGQLRDISGQLRDISRQIKDISGQIRDIRRQIRDISGQIRDISGQLRDIRGQLEDLLLVQEEDLLLAQEEDLLLVQEDILRVGFLSDVFVSICVRSGIDVGSLWDRSGVGPGSVWYRVWIDPTLFRK